MENTVLKMNSEMVTRRVLVVEDDPMWQTMISALINKEDTSAKIEIVDSVDKASKALNRRGIVYDLIILDFKLKENQSGYDLWLKVKNQFSFIPVVFVTGVDQISFYTHFAKYDERPKYFNKMDDFISLNEYFRSQFTPKNMMLDTIDVNRNIWLFEITMFILIFVIAMMN